jgi:general stress protein 26
MSGPTESHVWDMIEDIGIGMLTTWTGEQMRARPMAAYPDEGERCIWFMTDARGGKDEEVQFYPNVCVSFARPKSNDYLSLSGRAEIVSDRNTVEELWNAYAETFWPDGPGDPNIVLIRVEPVSAEYWEGRSNMLATAFALARARISGEKPDLGENKKVSMG